jgi:hypothetical protein
VKVVRLPLMSGSQPSASDWGVSVDEARAMLREQLCPICKRGPWKSPLNHAARKHGVDAFAMRNACGLTTIESVVDPELHLRFSERSQGAGVAAETHAAARRRKRKRITAAGKAALAKNLPARAAEERSAANLAAWDRVGRQPCGTVAAYRRGCRCESCRAAKAAENRGR